MIKISLVGDIGSGKTHISKLFKAPCFFADTEVKNLYRNNKQCFITVSYTHSPSPRDLSTSRMPSSA